MGLRRHRRRSPLQAADIDEVDRPKEPKPVGAARSEFERAVRSGTLSAPPTTASPKPAEATPRSVEEFEPGEIV